MHYYIIFLTIIQYLNVLNLKELHYGYHHFIFKNDDIHLNLKIL